MIRADSVEKDGLKPNWLLDKILLFLRNCGASQKHVFLGVY